MPALAIPYVTGGSTTLYTNVTDPMKLAFAPDGTLFVGRDNSGSGGSPSDAVRIHKIGTNASSLVQFGNVALADPDAVGYDAVGLVSGTPGAVLVGGSAGSSGATISKIAPSGTVSTLFGGVITNASNPGEFLFDAAGRVYVSDSTTHRVLTTATTNAPTVFCVSTGAYALAFDASNRLAVGSFDLPQIQLFSTNGTLLVSNFATIAPGAPVVAGRGDSFWGRDLYSINSFGQLIRINTQGTNTVVGNGFTGFLQMAFGPDNALYVSRRDADLIYRITEKIVNVPQPDHWWPGEGNGNDIIGDAHGVLAKSDGFHNVNFTPTFSYPTGVVGQCLVVMTNHSAFNFGTNAANVGTNDFTMCFWFNSTNTASRGLFGNRQICYYNIFWSVDIYNNGAVRLIVDDYIGSVHHYGADRYTTAKVCDGQWHHIAVQRSGIYPKVYLDGVEAAGANTGSYPANTIQIANLTNSVRFLMGGMAGIPEGYCAAPSNLNDAFDEVQLYYTALSADQIAKIAALQANTYGPPQLNIAALPNAVRLTWTTNSPGYALETNGNLASTNWGLLTTNYSVLETNYAVTNTVSPTPRFYRLRK